MVASTGCTPTLHHGWPPRIDALAELRPGVSTASDVLLVLGEPRGRGAARIARQQPTRDLWFYEYTEARGVDVAFTMLLVFFDAEHYVGYLWFSSELKPPATSGASAGPAMTTGRES